MGCSIHSFAEKRNKETNKWEKVGEVFSLSESHKKLFEKEKTENPFYWRSYPMFAFLAGVRNDEWCMPLSFPRGLPNDISDEVKEEYEKQKCDAHSASFLILKELLDFNYDKPYSILDVIKQMLSNESKFITYRDKLGEEFFTHLNELKEIGEPEDVRIVFWFDN